MKRLIFFTILLGVLLGRQLNAQCATWYPMAAYQGHYRGPAFASNDTFVYMAGGVNLTTQLASDQLQRFYHLHGYLWSTWQSMAPLSTPRYASAMAIGANGKVYIFGGVGAANSILSLVEEYDPSTNTWSTKASMPTPRVFAKAVEAGGKIYVIGGRQLPSAGLNVVEAYDPVTDTWSTMAPMPWPRYNFGACRARGPFTNTLPYIYVTGGFGPTMSSTFARYNYLTNTWQLLPPLPFRIVQHDMAFDPGIGELIMGGGLKSTIPSSPTDGFLRKIWHQQVGFSNWYPDWDSTCWPRGYPCLVVSNGQGNLDAHYGLIGGEMGSSILPGANYNLWYQAWISLPADELHLTAVRVGTRIQVDWEYAGSGVRTYRVERSPDGMGFEPLPPRAAVPNVTTYQWVDSFPLPGFNNYRVAAIDQDGHVAYSQVVRVSNGDVGLWASVAETGVPQHYAVAYRLPDVAFEGVARLCDLSGKLIAEYALTPKNGTLDLNLEGISSGVYFVTIRYAADAKTLKLLVR
jgi:N-acetylneuraminic acid mutarotase